MKTERIINTKRTLTLLTGASLALVSGCAHRHHDRQETHYHYSSPPPYAGTSTPQQQSYRTDSEGQTVNTTSQGTQTNMVIPLYRESINVGKREVDAGAVRVRKIVKTETVNQPVELRHEEVVIDREAGSGQAGQPGQNQVLAQPFQEQETVIRLKREEPVVEKQTSPAGQIVVQTRLAGQQTNLQAQVRREDVDIARIGNPQNVIIGQNVQGAVRSEDTGAAESPGGQTSGGDNSGRSDMITDSSMLSASADPSKLVGRSVQFSGIKVRQVIGDRLYVLSSDTGQPFYAVATEQTGNIQPGDTVNVMGTIKQTSSTSAREGLNAEAAQALNTQPSYIEAKRIESAGR